MDAGARAEFAVCLGWVLGVSGDEVPVPETSDPFVAWRGWLAPRGFGLVPIADPDRFSWPGYWLARDGSRTAVMFGVPSGPVFSPAEDGDPPELAVAEGYAVAALDLRDPPPGARTSCTGSVEALFVSSAAGAPMRPVASAEAARTGLADDRYHRGAGTFSNPDATGTALTLIEAEALEGLELPGGSGLAADEARRNVVTRGVQLDALVGRTFRIGEVECFGQRRCEPCAHLQVLTRPGVLRGLVHRGGLRADVVVPGMIAVGDVVRP